MGVRKLKMAPPAGPKAEVVVIHGDRIEPPEWLNEPGRKAFMIYARKSVEAGRWSHEEVRFVVEQIAGVEHDKQILRDQNKPVKQNMNDMTLRYQKRLDKLLGAPEDPEPDGPQGPNPFARSGFSSRHRKV